MLSAFINYLIDDYAICQALANPRSSEELTEFMQDIARTEASSLLREHNDVIQMQRDQIIEIRSERDRLQRERIENINAHAASVHALHDAHAAEIKELHGAYTAEIKGLHGVYAVEVQALHGECTQKIKNALAVHA